MKKNIMKSEVKKFLEFNGKVIYFIAIDGQYWIALKPICEAIGVHWKKQHEKLKRDKILSQLSTERGMVAADGKIREMTSLPEFAIYGWIFQIDSPNEDLTEYKWECYRVLYEHFHGAIAGRKDLLKIKAQAEIEIDQVMGSLNPDQAFKYQKAKKKLNAVNQKLRKLDTSLVNQEKDLFSN